MNDSTFNKIELATHREAAARGSIPSLEVCAKFIRSIRKTWNAMPKAKTTGKSRVKKEKPDERQVDFF